MNTLIKTSLIAASMVALGSSAALADDLRLQNRLDRQRQEMQRNQQTATIAVSSGGRGVGQVRRDYPNDQEIVWKTRQVGNGPIITYAVPAE